MSDDAATPPASDPDAIRADIERTRADLAATVDALSDKVNVKAQAGHKADAAKEKVSTAASNAKAAAPEPVQDALDSVARRTGPVAHHVTEAAAPHRGKIAAGAVAALVVLLVVRRRRARTR